MSSKIHCPKCDSQIGEIKNKKEIYYHKDDNNKKICLKCKADKKEGEAEISFFVIFIVVSIVVIWLAII